MKTFLILTMVLFVQTVAMAETVYLQCTLRSDKETRQIEIALDATTRKITHTFAGGSAFNTEGFFTADTITYQQISFPARGLKVTRQYTVHRRNLSFQEHFRAESTEYPREIPPKVTADQGACQLVTSPKNKI